MPRIGISCRIEYPVRHRCRVGVITQPQVSEDIIGTWVLLSYNIQ